MSTAEAIVKLRRKLEKNQRDFSRMLDVTVPSLSRYEHSKREPAGRVLKRLAELAAGADADYLADIFEAARRGAIASHVESLQSGGSARRVGAFELELWMARQREIYRVCTWILDKGDRLTANQQREILTGLRGLAEQTWNDLRPYQTGVEPDLNPNESLRDVLLTWIPELSEKDWVRCLYTSPVEPTGKGALASNFNKGKG